MLRFILFFYFSPRGRTGRRMYWWFGVLAPLLLLVLAGFALALAGLRPQPEHAAVIGFAIAPFTTWVAVAIGSRRLHDIGFSGWWMLAVSGTPFISSFVLPSPFARLLLLAEVVLLGVLPGTLGANRFGGDPTGRTSSVGAALDEKGGERVPGA
jgi:uncharacterized membrane protein YhaH (DUF805 family)